MSLHNIFVSDFDKVGTKSCFYLARQYLYRFTTYQDARRVRLVDESRRLVDSSTVSLIFETNILRVSPVNSICAQQSFQASQDMQDKSHIMYFKNEYVRESIN